MNLAVFVAASFATFASFVAASPQCPTTQPVQVPEVLDRTLAYPHAEGGFQIFNNLRAPCSGLVTHWVFRTSSSDNIAVHIGVFRQTSLTTYQQVGGSFINGQVFPEADGWVVYPASQQIEIMAGDVIGLYYEDVTSPNKILSRRFTDSPNPTTATIVLIADAAAMRNANYVADTSVSVAEHRVPALAAWINYFPAPPPTAPPVEPQPLILEQTTPAPTMAPETTTPTPTTTPKTTIASWSMESTPFPFFPPFDFNSFIEASTTTQRPSRTTTVRPFSPFELFMIPVNQNIRAGLPPMFQSGPGNNNLMPTGQQQNNFGPNNNLFNVFNGPMPFQQPQQPQQRQPQQQQQQQQQQTQNRIPANPLSFFPQGFGFMNQQPQQQEPLAFVGANNNMNSNINNNSSSTNAQADANLNFNLQQ